MIQLEDDRRIESLKKRLHAKTKIEIVRSALDLLEKQIDRAEKTVRWKKVAKLVSESSREVLMDFQHGTRFLRHEHE